MTDILEKIKKSKNFESVLEKVSKKELVELVKDEAELRQGEVVLENMISGSDVKLMGSQDEDPQLRATIEAVVVAKLRPTYLIQEDKIIINPADDEYPDLDLFLNNQSQLENTSKMVGRVDLIGHPKYDYVGTGWLVDNNFMRGGNRYGLVVTNRHVAQTFAHNNWLGKPEFLPGRYDRPIECRINNRRQHDTPDDFNREVRVMEMLYIARSDEPDMAFLMVELLSDAQPIEFISNRVEIDMPVVAIGYPAWDGTRNPGAEMDRYFRNIYEVKRCSPGYVIDHENEGVLVLQDYTTLGGNSGSPVLDIESAKAIGLHFAGSFMEANYAVSGSVVEAALRSVRNLQVSVESGTDFPAPEISEAATLNDRDGYDPEFLGEGGLQVPLPDWGRWVGDRAPVIDNSNHELKYTHFSVVQSMSRRLPLLTAVNIDGSKAYTLKRKGSWKLDGRISNDYQIGNELYYRNPLDRGHMVRRKDPGWGSSRKEAQQAEIDTFHYTNAAPQHEDLNQKDWLGLEDYILGSADTKDFKVAVMTGPIFRDTDKRLKSQPGAEDILVPDSFWKIAVMVNSSTERLSVTGYILTQGQMIKDLTEAAFVLGDYKTYQVQVAFIEAETDLNFGNLKDHDPLGQQNESVFGKSVLLLNGPESLIL